MARKVDMGVIASAILQKVEKGAPVGAEMPSPSLWANNDAVIFLVRRPG